MSPDTPPRSGQSKPKPLTWTISMSSMYTLQQQAEDVNIVAAFLARRDVPALLPPAPGAPQAADLLILAGNSLPCTATMAAAALEAGAAQELLITGGIGHATQYLRDAVALVPALQHIATAGRPEAEIMADMVSASQSTTNTAIRGGSCGQSAGTGSHQQRSSASSCEQRGLPVLLESASTNCGDNAIKSVELLQGLGRRPGTVLLVQDPTMQIRSHASFQKAFADVNWAPELLSFSPFVPQVEPSPDGLTLVYSQQLLRLQPLWPIERFVSLVIGEPPRLREYGPKGRGFIAAVEVPLEVEAAHARLEQVYGTRQAV